MDTESISPYNLRSWRMRIETNDRIHPGMKKLKLRGKELNNPPLEVFHLQELQVLDMSPERQACLFYHLPCVPPSIARLSQLRVLMLDTNELTIIPPEVGSLPSLERISLSNNYLTSLPVQFGKLVNLTSLHAANNEFEMMPSAVCQLTNLTFLDFSDNALVSVPSNIGVLGKLESLMLYSNKITRIPDSIANLKQLRCLWLGRNNIRKLPRGVEGLLLLDWGHVHTWSSALDGNPLQHPPLEVCKRGAGAMADYFRIYQDGN